MKLQKTIKCCPFGLVACFGTLGLLAFAMLCPIAPRTASAEGEVTEEYSSLFRALVHPVLAISIGEIIDVDVIPRADGNGYSANSMTLTVDTNNTSGFEVFIRGVDGNASNDNRTELKSSVTSEVISSTASTVALKDLVANTWGVYLGEDAPTADSEFQPVTSENTTLDKIETANASNQYKLGFGTKVDTSLPAGTYSNSVVVSVVANPLQVSGLTDLYFMQDMTADVCAASSVGDEAYVTDQRDGNKYWIAKLRDGRCWMVQNLDLDITADGFTSADTNISANSPNNGVWDTTSTYPPKVTSTTVPSAQSEPSQTDTLSWDFGKWVLATPFLTEGCGNATSISACITVGFVDVSNENNFKSTYRATTGDWEGANATSNTLVAVNCTAWSGSGTSKICTAGTYDPHYLIGNYYQYNTATAGSGGTITDADAVSSICPKGWQLPTAGSQANQTNGSFYNLLIGYGLESRVTSLAKVATDLAAAGNVKMADGTVQGYDVSEGEFNVAGAPLYFVRSGGVNIYYGKYSGVGSYSNIWSSRLYSITAYAYDIGVRDVNIYSSTDHNNRWHGLPLRCLSTV